MAACLQLDAMCFRDFLSSAVCEVCEQACLQLEPRPCVAKQTATTFEGCRSKAAMSDTPQCTCLPAQLKQSFQDRGFVLSWEATSANSQHQLFSHPPQDAPLKPKPLRPQIRNTASLRPRLGLLFPTTATLQGSRSPHRLLPSWHLPRPGMTELFRASDEPSR